MNAIAAMFIRAFEPPGKTAESKKLEHTLEWYERTTHDLESQLDQLEATLSEFEPEREREHDAAA